MKHILRFLTVFTLVIAGFIGGSGVANAVTPIDDHRFADLYICTQDDTTGSFYPLYVKTAAAAYDATPGVTVTYAHGVRCVDYGYTDRQVLRVVLIAPSDSENYPCAVSYMTLSGGTSGYHTAHPTVYYNYYKPECHPEYLGTDKVANLISKHFGRVSGLKLYAGGAGYSVMNTNRYDIRWATRYDATNCPEVEGGSGMVRRYQTACA